MRTYLFIAIFLFSANSALAENNQIEHGQALFESRCSDICHQTPALGRLRPKQWRIVMNTMQKRMASFGMAPLTPDEFEAILQYVSTNR